MDRVYLESRVSGSGPEVPSCRGDQKFIIRTSDRGIFRSCRQRWDWASKIRQDLEPKAPQGYFDFGTSIHSGLEVYYNPNVVDRSICEMPALSAFLMSEMGFRHDAEKLTLDGNLSDERKQEFDDRRDLGKGMLEHYFRWAPTVDNFRPVKTEIEFEVPIPCGQADLDFFDRLGLGQCVDGSLHWMCDLCHETHPVVYQGRVDLLVQDDFSYYWITDHKTAGQFGSTDWLDVDDQCGSYIWALRRVLGLPIRGVLYNRLLKSAPKPPTVLQNGGLSVNKMQRTTYDLYMTALQEHNQPYAPYAEFLEYLKQKPNQFFQRIPVHRGEEEDRTLERRILIEAIEMLSDPFIYPNPGMFNCMGCAYRVPCVATNDGSDLKYIIESLYQRRGDSDQSTGPDEGETDGRERGGPNSPTRL